MPDNESPGGKKELIENDPDALKASFNKKLMSRIGKYDDQLIFAILQKAQQGDTSLLKELMARAEESDRVPEKEELEISDEQYREIVRLEYERAFGQESKPGALSALLSSLQSKV